MRKKLILFLNFVIKFWWLFFIPALALTPLSAYLWYISTHYYTPQDAIEIMSWDYMPEEVEAAKPKLYLETLSIMFGLTITTFVPLPLLLYLRFFFKRNGRV